MDSFGKIVEILLTIILLFIAPLFIVAGIKDISTQTYINTQTTLFVDTVRNQGFIDRSLYDSYLKSLNISGNVYEIKMTHSCQMFDKNYNKYYMDYLNEDIFKGIEAGGYLMNNGDMFSVKVISKGKSLFEKMSGIFLGMNDIESVILCYGGIIRDEAY